MEKKSDLVRRFVSQRDYKKALALAKDFRLGITPEQSEMMKLGYECMVHARFYRSIGTDVEMAVQNGKRVVTELYGRS